MRPDRPTAVHRTGDLAELVCSNSLKSLDPLNAHGLLKEEMDRLGSLILDCARENRVPAGAALAVDREAFPEAVTRALEADPNITVIREEVQEIPEDGIVILAVGPLVSAAMAGRSPGSPARTTCTSSMPSRRSSRPTASTARSSSPPRATARATATTTSTAR